MVQLGYTVPKETMFVNHDYVSGTTKSLTGHFDEVCERILDRVELGGNDYVLDIGGNDGSFLKSFKTRGMSVLNVDSGSLQARLSNEVGIECLNTFFNADLSDRGRAAVSVRDTKRSEQYFEAF